MYGITVGFSPTFFCLTQAPTTVVWFDGIITVITTFLFMYCSIVFCFCCVSWLPGMAINVSVQYNDGSLSGIILLTQGYYHWGTHLNAMKRFCIFSV